MGLPKQKRVGQFVDLRGAWQERGVGIFEGEGGYTPMHTMYKPISYRQKSVTSNNLPGVEE